MHTPLQILGTTSSAHWGRERELGQEFGFNSVAGSALGPADDVECALLWIIRVGRRVCSVRMKETGECVLICCVA